jgi:uncharacterized membrane protein (UPF0127 family)
MPDRRAFAVAMLTLVLGGCAGRQPADQREGEAPMTTAPAAGVAVAADQPVMVTPSGATILLEVASNDETRARGLMFRESLALDRGMIFLFPSSEVHSFWMKNTYIPLDMLFIGEDSRIVAIINDVPPCAADPCPSYGPEQRALHVVELAAGNARRLGLKTGDQLTFRGLEKFVIR